MRVDTRTVVVLVVTLGVLASAVLASAVGGSWELEERDFEREAPPREDPEPFEMPEFVPDDLPEPREFAPRDWAWLAVVGWILGLLVVVLTAWWLWNRLRPRFGPRRRDLRGVEAVGSVDVEPELPVLRRGVSEAQRFLEEIAAPDDAVIAAWLALEEAAIDSGVRRRPAQTPTEFTVAILERTSADPEATAELLALYHRARFAVDAVDADDVRDASRCLGRLAASWDELAVPGGEVT